MKKNFKPLRITIAIVSFFILLAIIVYLSIVGLSKQFFEDKFRLVYIEPKEFVSGDQTLENPLRGEYTLLGYMIKDDYDINDELKEDLKYLKTDENHKLLLLELNLNNYLNKQLSTQGHDQIAQILSFWSNNGFDYIVRFVYDWNGDGLKSDPKSIETIESHMNHVAGLINDNHHHILTTQGIFVGSWGEMHDSKYMTDEDMTELMNHWYELTNERIYLAVRTPQHRRIILNTMDTLSDKEAYDGSLASRLGFFNDGLLSSGNDLGTYGETDQTDTTDIRDKFHKSVELDYQDELCKYVPNGGEICIDTEYSDPDVICETLEKMHLSYINLGPVTEKLENYTINDDSVWSGHTMKDYLLNHVGYRYEVTGFDSEFNPFTDDAITFNIHVKNNGFAPIYKPTYCRLHIYDETSDDTYDIWTLNETQLRDISSGEEKCISFKLPRYNLVYGYKFYIEFLTEDNRVIELANSDLEHDDEKGYHIGTFYFSRDDSAYSTMDKIKTYMQYFKLYTPYN